MSDEAPDYRSVQSVAFLVAVVTGLFSTETTSFHRE